MPSIWHKQMTRRICRLHTFRAELGRMDYLCVFQNMVGFNTFWNHCNILFNVISQQNLQNIQESGFWGASVHVQNHVSVPSVRGKLYDLCRRPSVFCSNSTNHRVLQQLFRIFVSSMTTEFKEIQITSEPDEWSYKIEHPFTDSDPMTKLSSC